MTKVHAIFQNGVFRPTEPVQVPEGAEVDLSIEQRTSLEASEPPERPRIEIRDGRPVIIAPPGSKPITNEDVARMLDED